MNRNRFIQYRTNQGKYTLRFFENGLRRIFTDLRYAGIALGMIALEIVAYFKICEIIDSMELWPSLIQVYKRVIIVPLAVLFLFAVTEIGRPRGFRRIMREMEKIPRILNGDNEAPVLISRERTRIGKPSTGFLIPTDAHTRISKT